MQGFLRRAVLSAIILAAGACRAPAPQVAMSPVHFPARLSDQEFWTAMTSLSEPPGTFMSENYLSNELGYQRVMPALLAAPITRRAYLGVGPEQNFTYIATLEPAVAVIFDIRRGNLLGQLLYKALFELSADRAEFVSRLFSKPRPDGLDARTTVDSLFAAFWLTRTDSVAYRMNRTAVFDLLLHRHGFALSPADTAQMRAIYDVFYYGGPRVDYRYPVNTLGATPSYRDLMVAEDSVRVQHGFLSSEALWQHVRAMEMHNLIVPVVADFAGPTAIRAVGDWLRQHRTTVGAFYLSNVEQYLFRSDAWRAFFDNAATLPYDSGSLFIRSTTGGAFADQARASVTPGVAAHTKVSDMNSVAITMFDGGFISVTSPMADFLSAYHQGHITTYLDVVKYSR